MIGTSLRLVAGGLVAAAVLTAGCGSIRMGAAAVVGDQRITTADLEQSVNATEQAAERNQLQVNDRSLLQRGILNRLIFDAILEAAAERKDITVSRGQVDRALARFGDPKMVRMQLLQQRAVPPEEVRDDVRHQLIQRELADSLALGQSATDQRKELTTYLRSTAREIGVSVSPRYGRFDMRRLTVVPADNELSRPESGTNRGS